VQKILVFSTTTRNIQIIEDGRTGNQMKQEMQQAYNQGYAAYLQTPTNYENPYLENFSGMKARAWDQGFKAAMVKLASGR